MTALTDLTGAVSAATSPLLIAGGHSKLELLSTPATDMQPLEISGYAGIIDYEPKELVLRAKAGTTIAELNAALAAEGQILAFDPPSFGERATLGGTVASGLSGARRPWFGAVRDFVLGVGVINGDGEYIEFGGQVMKNVAGFDVSRLMCGSWGTLGVIADVSLKTLPAPEQEVTLAQAMSRSDAHRKMLEISNRSMPVSGLAWDDETLFVRLSGAAPAVEAARSVVGGDEVDSVLEALADYSRFKDAESLWRVSVAPASNALLDEAAAIDWGGAQRWIVDGEDPRERLEGGHATLVIDRKGDGADRNQPLAEPVATFHRRLKNTFDPKRIFNPELMYAGL